MKGARKLSFPPEADFSLITQTYCKPVYLSAILHLETWLSLSVNPFTYPLCLSHLFLSLCLTFLLNQTAGQLQNYCHTASVGICTDLSDKLTQAPGFRPFDPRKTKAFSLARAVVVLPTPSLIEGRHRDPTIFVLINLFAPQGSSEGSPPPNSHGCWIGSVCTQHPATGCGVHCQPYSPPDDKWL